MNARLIFAAVLFLAYALPSHGFFSGTPPVFPEPPITVYEYVNDIVHRYVLLNNSSEIAAVDAGAAGPGWHRTGYSFEAYPIEATPGHVLETGLSAVYRYYGPAVNSHFYTAQTAEYNALRNSDLGWIYEGPEFSVYTPQSDGTCAAKLSPVWRLYNNRAMFGDTDHRYVYDRQLHDSLVAQGWIDEGVNFCVEGAGLAALTTFSMTPVLEIRTASDCSNEAINLGPCVGMNSLPSDLPNKILYAAPPDFGVNPTADAARSLTGFVGDVRTAQPVDDAHAVLSHTFVQQTRSQGNSAPWIGGMHVISTDAAAPLASIDLIYQFTTTAPPAGQPDARIFPWRVSNEARLDFEFVLFVATIKTGDAASHAYGNTLIEFRDAVSGQAIDVTVLVFGTIPPGDFVSINDPSTGNVWVSTTAGNSMLFGSSLGNGHFIACTGTAPCPSNNGNNGSFVLHLTSTDFAGIVARARALNPALSADIKDYLLVRYLLRNGILGNAEVGAAVYNMSLSLSGRY